MATSSEPDPCPVSVADTVWRRFPVMRQGVAGWFGLSTCAGVAPLYPDITAALKMSTGVLGLLVAVSALVSAACQLPCGLAVDRGKAQLLTYVGVGLPVVTLAVWSASTTSVMLASGWILLGVAIPCLQAGTLTTLLRQVPRGVRGRAMSRIWAAASAGTATSTVLFGFGAQYIGWRAALLSGAAIPAAALIIVRLSGEARSVTSPRGMVPPVQVVRFLARPQVFVTICAASLVAATSAAVPVIAPFVLSKHSLNSTTVSVVLLTFTIAGIVGGPVVGRSSDRWGASRPLGAVFACASASLALVSLVWVGAAMYALDLAITGSAVAGGMGVLQGLIASQAELPPDIGVGVAVASYRIVVSLTASAAPLFGGLLLEGSARSAESALGVVMAIAAVLVALVRPADVPMSVRVCAGS